MNYNEYVEYRAICNSQRNYVFNAKNMMDYTVSLDNYSVVQNKDTYNAFLPAAQAKYCVDRVVQALNYKDYDFVYSKLNPVQKNNYYKNVNEFKNYLSKALYEQNSYEIDDNYLIISDNVYQFTVTIRDATGGEFTYSKFTITDFFSFKNPHISSDCSKLVGCDITILIDWFCGIATTLLFFFIKLFFSSSGSSS